MCGDVEVRNVMCCEFVQLETYLKEINFVIQSLFVIVSPPFLIHS